MITEQKEVKITALTNYGGVIKRDEEYTLLKREYDCYKIKIRGFAMYVPLYVFENK